MANAIGELIVALKAETASFRADLTRAARNLKSQTSRMRRDLEGLNRQFGTLGRSIRVGLGALGVGLGFTSLSSQLGRLVSDFAAVGDAADRIGISARRLQELRFAAEQSASSAQTMDEALSRLNRRLGLAAAGGGPAASAFERLGVELRNAEGGIRGVGPVFDDVVSRLQNITSDAELAAVASQLFGERAGPELAVLLRQGSEGIAELSRRASTLDDDLVARAQRAQEAWLRFSTTIRVNVIEAVLGLAAAIDQIATGEVVARTAGELERAVEQLQEQIAFHEAVIEDLRSMGAPDSEFANNVALLEQYQENLAAARDELAALGEETRRTETPPFELPAVGGTDDPTARAQRFIETLDRQVSAVREQIAALTRSEEQMASWRTTIEQASIVAAENAEITPQQAQEIRNLTDRLAESTRQLQEQRAAMEAANEAAREAEQQNQRLARAFTDFGRSVVRDIDNAGEALERFGFQLADLILEMTVFEQIRSGIEDMDLFGSGSGGESGGGGFFSGIGDFFGDLFGGLFADGGRPPLGRVSIVGEDGPEWFIPDVAGTIVPMDAIGGGGPVINIGGIDARGAERGTAIAIEQAVRRAVGESVTAVQQMARAGRMRDMGFS